MIHANILKDAGIDCDAGLERFMKDAELYEAVLSAFAADDIVERARAAFDGRNTDMLLRVIHEAKGASGNAGMDAVYTLSAETVAMLRKADFTEEALAESYLRFEKRRVRHHRRYH